MAGGALLSTIVFDSMTPPRTHWEWAVGVISTVVTGIGGVAIAVQYFRLQECVESVTGLVALGELTFGCGLPAGNARTPPTRTFPTAVHPRACGERTSSCGGWP